MPVVNISIEPEDLFHIEGDEIILCGSITAPLDIFFAELFKLLTNAEFENRAEAIPSFIACIRALEEKKHQLRNTWYFHTQRSYPKPQLIELEKGISYHHIEADSE